jgi:hypothetical protein
LSSIRPLGLVVGSHLNFYPKVFTFSKRAKLQSAARPGGAAFSSGGVTNGTWAVFTKKGYSR